MNLDALHRIYFAGIGGIGMSALARFFLQRGASVSGYDRTETDLTRALVQEGAAIHYTDDPSAVDKAADLVVYTPAIPADHQELNWFRAEGYTVVKRSDVLQWITESMNSITVAGTHGKTTVSTMTGYLLREAGAGCNAFLGGISADYNTNYWSSNNNVAVVEADEYDRSFLKLRPDIAVLTAMDPDHLDIYGTAEAMEEAFIEYTGNIKAGGTLLARHGLRRGSELGGDHKLTYSVQNDAADVYARNIVQHQGGYRFDVVGQDWIIEDLSLPIGGMHNVENAVAAIAVTQLLGVDKEAVRSALARFSGVHRRFEYVVKSAETVYIDDYAHHPEELRSLIESARRLFAGRRLVVAFQPHLFSRTADLADGFARSLDLADEVLLLDIYPARELPVPGVTSAMIRDRMENRDSCEIVSKDALLEFARAARPSLFITAGAGDIDKLVPALKEILQSN